MRLNNSTEVRSMKISQDMSKKKDMLNNNNMMQRMKNMITHQIFIVNQGMSLRPTKNLMTGKVSLP